MSNVATMFSQRLTSLSAPKILQMTSKMFETFVLTMATMTLISSTSVAAATSAASTIGFTEQPQLQPHAAALISSPSVSESLSSASSITKPDYGITNVTAQIGTNAYLPCKVSEPFLYQTLGNRSNLKHISHLECVRMRVCVYKCG